MRRRTSGFIVSMFAAASLSAVTYTVTNTADSGAGSLRQAILDASDSPPKLITGGCGNGNCPLASSTRGQMTVFVGKTFFLF